MSLTCGKDAPDNAYFGALLRVFDFRTKRNRRRNTYQLDPKDLELTKADLIARLPRNVEKFGELAANPESQWVSELYGRSTPFENTNKQGCGSSQFSLLDNDLSEHSPPSPEPRKIPPVQPEPTVQAIAPKTPREMLQAVSDAMMALARGDRGPLNALCASVQDISVIRQTCWELDNLCGGKGMLSLFLSRWSNFASV